MKLKDIVEIVSSKSNVPPKVVRKVMTTMMDILKEQISKQEKVRVQGFGTFISKSSKDDPTRLRIAFKPSTPQGAEKMASRKAAKQART